jgi:hypothetical protein
MGKSITCKKCKIIITISNKPKYKNLFISPKFGRICNKCLIIQRSQQKRKRKKYPQLYKNPYDDKYNPNKDKCNEIFINFLGNPELKENECIVALDGELRRTTSYLNNSGIKNNNILLLERDTKLAKKNSEKGIPCHGDSIESFVDYKYSDAYLNTYWKYLYRGFNFDTCGHVDVQGKGILKFLTSDKINFCRDVTLSFTFDKRLRTKGATFIKEHKKFIRHIKTYFSSLGFNISNYKNFSYYGKDNTKSIHNCNMNFTILNLSKNSANYTKIYNKRYYYNSLEPNKKVIYKEKIKKKFPELFSDIFY